MSDEDTYSEGHKALWERKAANDKATRDFSDRQQARIATKGVPRATISAPLKKQSRQATGGYRGGDPFKK